MSVKRSFFAELKRRNVVRMAGLYLVGAWLLTQVASTVLPTFDVPSWALRGLIITLVLGFFPALIVSWIFELTPQGLKRDEEVAPEQSIAPQTARRMDRMIIAVLVLALGYFAFDKFVLAARHEAPGSPKAPGDNKPVVIPEKSIAVLPFENLSSDKENAYFADGIQDEILTRLSKIAALKVISRTSTKKYKSAPDNLREVGKQLGVANILEGSVQKIGNAAHITVQLIRAGTDEHLWAESYDRALDDIFGVEKEVAQNIAAALKAKLTNAEERSLAQKPTENPAAYEAYLRGKALVWEGNESALRGSIQSYEEAVRLDPQFALAWAGLSSARSVGFYYMGSTAADRAAAEQSLAKAEELQPDLPEIQVARANFGYFVLGDNKHVREVLEQLHLIWPNNAEVVQLLAFTYQRLGEWQKATEAFDQVIVLNPRDLQARKFAAYTRSDVRDWPGAQRVTREALQVWPADRNLLAVQAQIFQANGQLDDAQPIVDGLKPDRVDYDAVGAVWYQAKLRRKPETALQLFETLGRRSDALKEWVRDALILGELQLLSGDTTAARATFATVRDAAEAGLPEEPDNVRWLGILASASAGVGERERAVAAIDKAIALQANDARTHPYYQETKARILARFGDKDGALDILSHLLQISYEGGLFGPPLTPSLLRLDPDWDNLRGDPRFEKLAAGKP